MTAQRLARGGKAKIIVGIIVVVLVFIAIFRHENLVSQYDNLKKRFETCTQQTESLTVNLQGNESCTNSLYVYSSFYFFSYRRL